MAKELVPASEKGSSQNANYLNILAWRQARGASQQRFPIPRRIELGHPVAHGHAAESIICVEKPASVVQESKWRTANTGGELSVGKSWEINDALYTNLIFPTCAANI